MGHVTRRLGLIALLSLLPITTAACGRVQPSAGSPSDHLLAVVNGQPISQSQWLAAVHATDVLRQFTLSTTPAARRREVQQLTGEIVVEQYALKHHWVTVSKAQQEASEFLSENVINAFGNKTKLANALKEKHLTVESFTTFLVRQMELDAAFAHAAVGVKSPSQAQLRSYYRAHRSLFTRPRQDKMRMILVKNHDFAQTLMKKLQRGASWKVLAARYSLDPASKNVGGEYGWVDTGAASGFVAPFYQEMDKLKPGQYGIADSQYGYHVIEVQATRPPQLEKFSAVASALASNLLQQRQMAAFATFTKRIEKTSRIVILDESRRQRQERQHPKE